MLNFQEEVEWVIYGPVLGISSGSIHQDTR